MLPLITGKTEVRSSAIHGVGVFALPPLVKDEIIEQCYCLPITEYSASLEDYNFNVDDKRYLALGLGSIYNHSTSPNAIVEFSVDRRIMVVRALQDIAANDEIFIDYGPAWLATRERFVYTTSPAKKWLGFLCKLIIAIAVLCLVVYLAHEVNKLANLHPFHAPLPLEVKLRGT